MSYGAKQTSEEVQFRVNMREVGSLIAKNREIIEGRVEQLENELQDNRKTKKSISGICAKLSYAYAEVIVNTTKAKAKLAKAEKILSNADKWFNPNNKNKGVIEDLKGRIGLYKDTLEFFKNLSRIEYKKYAAVAKITDIQKRFGDLIKNSFGENSEEAKEYFKGIYQDRYKQEYINFHALRHIGEMVSSPSVWSAGNGRPEVSNSGEELFNDNLTAFIRYVKANNTIRKERIGTLYKKLLNPGITGSEVAQIFQRLADAYAEMIVNQGFAEGRLADAEALLSNAHEWFSNADPKIANRRKSLESQIRSYAVDINEIYDKLQNNLGSLRNERSEEGRKMSEAVRAIFMKNKENTAEFIKELDMRSESVVPGTLINRILSALREYRGLLKLGRFMHQLEFKRYTVFADIYEILQAGDKSEDSRAFKQLVKRYDDLIAENRSVKIERINNSQVADRDRGIVLAYGDMVRNDKEAMKALKSALKRLEAGDAVFVDPWELEYRLKKVIGDYIKETGVIYKEAEEALNAMVNDAGDGKNQLAKAMEKTLKMSSEDYAKVLEELERLRGLSYYRFDRRAVAGTFRDRRAFLKSCLKGVKSARKVHLEDIALHR